MKRVVRVLLCCVCAMVLCGCKTSAAAAISQGEEFQTGGDGYMLSEIVRMPKYDADKTLGYGVEILMKNDSAPVRFSSGNSVESLIALTLDDGDGGTYRFSEVSFALNGDAGSSYKGSALFIFCLPEDAAFPETGTFAYTGGSQEETVALSFKGMTVSDAGESEEQGTEAAAPVDTPTNALAEASGNEVPVTSLEEFKACAEDPATTAILVAADMDITEAYTLERSGDLEIHVGEGVMLTISGSFEMVDCTLMNDGFITISGEFVYGISTLVNNNAFTVADGGMVTSGQSSASNNGFVTVDAGGQLFIERGTVFGNAGELNNEGYLCVRDGGQLNDEGGSIANNGTMDVISYYNGDITAITGTGTLNDQRE